MRKGKGVLSRIFRSTNMKNGEIIAATLIFFQTVSLVFVEAKTLSAYGQVTSLHVYSYKECVPKFEECEKKSGPF